MSELDKMRDYLGGDGATITAADIEEITSQGVGVEPEVWAITDALGERNLEKALAATRRFEQENGFAVLVTTVVERFFRTLVDLKSAETDGTFGEATQGMNAFAVRKNSGFLRNWTLNELRMARWRFLSLRERAVSSSASVDTLVTVEMARVCGIRRSRR
jgi:DNA polymerase III delta subunit